MRAVIDKYAGLPFRYGVDCCQFAGECVESLTGNNPMDVLNYSNKKEAYEIINADGDLEGAMRRILGEPYDGCKDGDVCLIESGQGQAAAIIFNNEVIARVKGGLMNYPISRALLVWET